MKFLFDQNLSPRLVNLLSDLYPDSNHVYPLGLDRNSDKEVWEYARREGFLMVTKDADFSDLCMLLGFPPKVVWIPAILGLDKPCVESALAAHVKQSRQKGIAK
ncbi:MAG: DUF5615 family PIN-like protein [Acidobacteria bacterium]|nr:DUF5615 family PIN-like protein [Acidobacteriota bacterium]MCW5969668.1 DUF5615 family PIN-like protein [Blastocatellales bacterium]